MKRISGKQLAGLLVCVIVTISVGAILCFALHDRSTRLSFSGSQVTQDGTESTECEIIWNIDLERHLFGEDIWYGLELTIPEIYTMEISSTDGEAIPVHSPSGKEYIYITYYAFIDPLGEYYPVQLLLDEEAKWCAVILALDEDTQCFIGTSRPDADVEEIFDECRDYIK